MSENVDTPDHDVRGVLSITPFRKLWVSLGLSSFGDWLGLLATTAMANQLGGLDSYVKANLAVSAVLMLRLLPAIIFGPIAGVVADRFDRKRNMVVGDILRAAIYISIPVIGTLPWLLVATVLAEIVGLMWMPAKDASIPNLVPRNRLEAANQVSLAATYGTAPFAAVAFSASALLYGMIDSVAPFLRGPNDIALYANAATYLYAAWVIAHLHIPRGGDRQKSGKPTTGFVRSLVDGWAFVGSTPLIRGLVTGMLGAFAAGGFVIGVAPQFTSDLGAGSPGFGIMFGAVFTGLALGMWQGPRMLKRLARWRLFALSLIAAGLFLIVVGLVPEIVLAAFFTVLVGAAAGVAWVTGYTMLGLEVDDDVRGRTFAFVQSSARVALVGVMALAPLLAALFGTSVWHITPRLSFSLNGAALTLLVGAVVAVVIGVIAYRTMDDHGEVTLWQDLRGAFDREAVDTWWVDRRRYPGLFVALEGGDGVGKSTQVDSLRRWLVDDLQLDVVFTREPGATEMGKEIRQMVLHGRDMSERAEALLFAADRAQHVHETVVPALRRGAIVITDRFIDSSVAYQGAARGLGPDEIVELSRFATDDLRPDLTVVLDLETSSARGRRSDRETEDRIEAAGDDFHETVRNAFLAMARRNPRRYLVVDASQAPDEVAGTIRRRLAKMLPDVPG